MFSKFLSLEPGKRERIINAALKEFAQKGFDNASTNAIVKEANISKGLLFHYFKSKKDLFIFLYDYFTDVIGKEFYGKIKLGDRDLFDVVEQTLELKLELVQRYPEMFNFNKIAYFEIPECLKQELQPRNQANIAVFYKKLREGIDTAKFKEGVDIEQAMNVVQWTLDGFTAQNRGKIKSLEMGQSEVQRYMAELRRYLDFLRTCFYK